NLHKYSNSTSVKFETLCITIRSWHCKEQENIQAQHHLQWHFIFLMHKGLRHWKLRNFVFGTEIVVAAVAPTIVITVVGHLAIPKQYL
ncbi:hypothetical protein VIGAN_08134900, partial [Vigna angularis var. angularis]